MLLGNTSEIPPTRNRNKRKRRNSANPFPKIAAAEITVGSSIKRRTRMLSSANSFCSTPMPRGAPTHSVTMAFTCYLRISSILDFYLFVLVLDNLDNFKHFCHFLLASSTYFFRKDFLPSRHKIGVKVNIGKAKKFEWTRLWLSRVSTTMRAGMKN